MQLLGIVGYPLQHTLSPVIQQAAIDFYGLPLRYEVWETPPEGLAAAVERLRGPEYLGMNVTVPHKEAIIPLLDRLERRARRIGAVNTVLNQRGRLTGYNTDAEGFQRALEDEAGFTIAGCRAVVLGAGGVARAVGVVLAEAGAAEATIVNRHPERAQALVRALRRRRSNTQFQALPWDEAQMQPLLARCDLLVNCTSIGMKHTATEGKSPLSAGLVLAQALVFDLVYNPGQTALLRLAKEAGARTLGGISMLVYQGVAAFEIWTQRQAPVGLMRERACEALGI
ncbi:MAG: shikimate dehydrogenase [Bacteroidetes bacterium]|nr:shikimate dehydrogenase [Bacteroidota bacterium]MCL5026125.1 shikimate dehydrogenase [Chloroflexota bacterium]